MLSGETETFEGLTEEQKTRLLAARKSYAVAQALADEHKAVVDELERMRFIARVYAVRKRRAARSTTDQYLNNDFTLPEDSRKNDLPQPARMMVIERRVSIRDLLNPPTPAPLPAENELIEQYRLVRSINSFAFWLGLRRHAAIKVLKSVGIDVYGEVARDWEAGESIRELSRRHGPGRDTISSWIKRTGRTVPVANSRQRYDEELILEIYEKTNSCNSAANAAGVAWRTAKAVLIRYGK
ncbi:hypothetical protein ACEYYA_14975 [Paracoccus sp. p3-h83]|uniref:hypothetical protein n=1 Tax=Paracoccus sp. p3-h83 TaxID=3342805 RepID=UPI0035B6CE03